MAMLDTSIIIDSTIVLLTEAYDGPPNPRGTWWIDNEANSGILGVLDRVSAAEASTSVDGSGDRGTTIAANAEHLRWSLANANATFRGAEYQASWSESWNVLEADEANWNRLRQELRDEYNQLVGLLKKQTSLEGEYLLGTLALVPHAAFHLGLIRQMVERVKQPKSDRTIR
jgi:hypothetical protein